MKNLATAVQVSIDTAVQHCEVKFGGRELGYPWAAFTFLLEFRPCIQVYICVGRWRWHGVLMVAMVEPTRLGSVSIRKGEWWRGRAESLVSWRPYAFVIFSLWVLGRASAVSVGFMFVVVLTNQLCQWEVMSK